MPICPRQKVFFFFVVVVVASALLCSSFAGLSLPPAPAFSFEWREFFFFLFLLRPAAAECYIWDSIFFLSYVQVSRAAVAQQSGYYYYYCPPPNRSSNGLVRFSRSPPPPSCWVWFPPPACMPVAPVLSSGLPCPSVAAVTMP